MRIVLLLVSQCLSILGFDIGLKMRPQKLVLEYLEITEIFNQLLNHHTVYSENLHTYL